VITLSDHQNQARKSVQAWLSNWTTSSGFFYLGGYAGTGKTTIARVLAEEMRSVCYASFTGKAAHVMRQRGCDGASTIHSLIYAYEDDDETGKPCFSLNPDSPVSCADLVVIDECSMVDEFIGHDLIGFGRPILVLGDPAQLPPVKGAGYFTRGEPDYMLTEIRRQDLESPILRLATDVRSGRGVSVDSVDGCAVVRKPDVDPDAWKHHDQIIVGTNAMRRKINARVRELSGFEGIPQPSERVICLRNNKKNGLFNGQIWDVAACAEEKKKLALTVTSEERTLECTAHREPFEGLEPHNSTRRNADEFDYSYAITGHKSQGSEWGSVLAFDQSSVFREDAQRWLYTVITRASERLTLVV